MLDFELSENVHSVRESWLLRAADSSGTIRGLPRTKSGWPADKFWEVVQICRIIRPHFTTGILAILVLYRSLKSKGHFGLRFIFSLWSVSLTMVVLWRVWSSITVKFTLVAWFKSEHLRQTSKTLCPISPPGSPKAVSQYSNWFYLTPTKSSSCLFIFFDEQCQLFRLRENFGRFGSTVKLSPTPRNGMRSTRCSVWKCDWSDLWLCQTVCQTRWLQQGICEKSLTTVVSDHFQVLVRDANSDVLFSTDIFNLEPLVQAVCDIAKIKYRDIMSIENLQISDPPVGIF